MVPPSHVRFGGMSSFEYHLCKALAHMGHEVTLLTSDIVPGRNSLSRGDRITIETEVETGFQVKRTSAIANLGGDMPIMPLLPLELKRIETDVIHAHEYYNYGSLVSWALSKARKIPFTYTQDRYYFVKRRVWQPFFRLLNGTLLHTARNSPRFVTAFSAAAADFLSSQGYPQGRISIIPLGVDIAKFAPIGEGWLRNHLGLQDDQVVISVARLHPSKNLESLINALALLSHHNKKVKLVIVGRGPQSSQLQAHIRELGLEKQAILFTEPVPYDNMPGVYNSCDLLVLPSLYEPFGMAVLEAMACAKPVIVSDVGGMRDTVANGQTGFRISLTNQSTFTKELASKINELLAQADLRRRIGKAARERVERLYDWEIIARSYDGFYRMLAS